MNYRYHLLKYAGPASRLSCPACGRKRCFTPYVDADDRIIGEQYGRCDHESSCGYVRYPPSPEPDWRDPSPQYRRRAEKPVRRPAGPKTASMDSLCTIPMELVLKTVRTKPLSDFLRFLCEIFDPDTILRLVSEYALGVTRSGDIIYYQIDTRNRCRTGKVMKYDPATGRRIKDPAVPGAVTWVHALLKRQGKLPQDWTLTQCLFGEHLLTRYPDRIVGLVESEKTALICAALMPEGVWVAAGGKGQLGDKVEVLRGRKVVAFPDADALDTWTEKIAERPHLDIRVSNILEQLATPEEMDNGADLADVLIRWLREHGQNESHVRQAPPPAPEQRYADNPVMREVMRYITPEYWAEADALIRDFDLELVSVTQMPKD